MQNKKLVLGTLFILVLVFVALGYFYKSGETKKEELVTLNNSDLLVREHSMKFGENKKNVLVVEIFPSKKKKNQ